MVSTSPTSVRPWTKSAGARFRWMIDDIMHGIVQRIPTTSHQEPHVCAELTEEELEDYIEASFEELRKAVLRGCGWLAVDLAVASSAVSPELSAQVEKYLLDQARATAWTTGQIERVRESLARSDSPARA